MTIAIIDYGLGNVKSVANALAALDIDSVLTSDQQKLADVEGLILPGVGAFGDGMDNIRDMGLYEVILREVKDKCKPILGICLGMQLLADGSDEFGAHEGFGFIPGWAKRLTPSARSFKVPHIGWNDIEVTIQEPLFNSIEETPDYYFVHSYYFEAKNESDVSAWCDHGGRFAAAVQIDNVFGVQFHPEKSQKAGISLLKKFYGFVKSC